MSKIINPRDKKADNTLDISSPLQRRSFIKYAGAGAALSALILSGCNDDDDGKFNGVVYQPPTPPPNPNEIPAVNLGSGDTGILNYAYALEQLEAAFYDMLVKSTTFNTTFTNATERAVLTDIRDHEVAHRDFFKSVLGNAAIPALTPDFSLVNMADRNVVLMAARTFEDVGVAAYNGAGKLLTMATNLALAGKIVSVEARHAAEIREMLKQNTFAARGGASPKPGDENIINDKGLDLALMPNEVLALAKPFIKNDINASSLPTS
ncbi:ferritin-like domain-containing protein [Adhaeribacter swui]|uniref:Ferritin-like domain-containing protein n=1 Tax=Adhaeribacter swui TaxID=2086471 RepID=A0A7G7G4I1_9BACT|nr:ferritin-like domain-containing protein [Adhaeribacter swui]QNF32065.1 ferritin-like domain-containing protein [Adhaeribacter swui]